MMTIKRLPLLVVLSLFVGRYDAWITNQPANTFYMHENRQRALQLHVVPHHKLDLNLLLIDHYDSFTYNLVDILAQYTTHPPLVVAANAATTWDDLVSAQNGRSFDGVILSPGPGHPKDPEYALSRNCILKNSNLPILGVCLGHQLLGTVHGAKVDLAPEPIHGQVQNIRLTHNNIGAIDPLWEGVADTNTTGSPIQVTRYHSLHVFDLNNTSLVSTAVTEDANSVVMSMRHVENPHFGLQFHPESIGTNETGKRLLHNFVKICARHQRERRNYADSALPLPQNSVMVPPKQHSPAVEPYSIYIHKVPNLPPNGANMRPVDVVYEILSNEPYYFWLDEARPVNEMNPGVSILGASKRRVEYWGNDRPKEEQGVFVWDENDSLVYKNHSMDIITYLHKQTATITNHATMVDFGESFSSRRFTEDALNAILPFDFRGGHVGFLGYEVRHDTQRYQEMTEAAHGDARSTMIETNNSTVPTAAFVWADKSFVFDHKTDEWYLVGVQLNTDENSPTDNSTVIDWMSLMSKRLIEGLSSRPENSSARSKPVRKGKANLPFFTPNRPRSTYIKNFAQCLEHIRQGESYELCLTNQFDCQVSHTDSTSMLNLYNILRGRNPAPFSALFHWNPVQNMTTVLTSKLQQISAVSICCTSPERFVSVKRKQQEIDGSPCWEVEAKPIKGTIQRILPSIGRKTLTELEARYDQELAHQLLSSVKDRAENLMIVDLLRNDLSQVCRTGSVHVSKLMDIESFATVHQMVSTIRGALRDDQNSIDVLKACFPGGSMTGAPKARTMELLHEIEDRACRGPYSGCLGYISVNGCMDMNIIIRTAILTPEWSTQGVASSNQRNDLWKVSIGAGGAITALSQPTDEYDEMKLKASAIIGAVEKWACRESDALEDDTHPHRLSVDEYNYTFDNKENVNAPLIRAEDRKE